MADRPRILLVPMLTELEWPTKPLIEEWADVASFDIPGVGSEPRAEGSLLEAAARRGLEELDRRGWERAVLAADEFGAVHAVLIAALRPGAVWALALGHACIRFKRSGDRPTINPEIADVQGQLMSVDYRTFVQQVTRLFDRRDPHGRPDPELAASYLERVSQEMATAYWRGLLDAEGADVEIETVLRHLDVPLLLARHEGCLLWTDEGYEDAVEAFPEATTFSTPTKPSIGPDFVEPLRDFCTRLPG